MDEAGEAVRWACGADEELLDAGALAPGGLGMFAGPLGIVGRSAPVATLARRIEVFARSHATVLIRGETGSGKELVARALHRLSPRVTREFLPHNFASIPDTLVESELFGHARGAFTGAHADRAGLFEQAQGGTLFLDEIGDASPGVQSRLLRVIQEGEIRRLGDERARRVDVRVVAATHRDLAEAVRAGRFRDDLYYRLHVLEIDVPSLRERPADVPLLTAHIMGRLGHRDGLQIRGVTRGALRCLLAHGWPGNVRELEAVVTRAAHATGADGVITRGALGALGAPGGLGGSGSGLDRAPEALRERTRAFEADAIGRALQRHGGNRTRAARELGITRQGLWKKLRRLRGDGHDAVEGDWS
jgi:transcriptional regulator with PAS, ATPase and Fis domain